MNLTGARPRNLGVQADGSLRACRPGAGNCVCSQHPRGARDPNHVQPFRYSGNAGDAMTRLLAVLLQQPRCRLVSTSPTYIHAEFQSALLGFVDDAEFLLASADSLIHVRSAARLGLSDFGINRARVEQLRVAFDSIDE
ncbi:DUF1499 domain-containing protein [Stagnimonas aquatica]|uniref:DUF1499 domain-containing protein n=1 Tax=Stagnimonas aquatica TaxID=2689987 RepID=A0A3N0VM52_9GAMM|nr:DUF1499 domain-containing protein [Stagnimonas aquatica]